MHGPDPSWCARLHAANPPRPAQIRLDGPTISESASIDRTRDSTPADAPSHPPVDSPATLPQGSPYVYRDIPSVHECELCGTEMYDHNCKIVCPNCGYKRDCSDP